MSDRQKLQIDRPMLGDDAEFLTVHQVADLIQLPYKSCYTVVGGIALELAPRTLRWRKSDVLAWISSKARGGLAA